MKRIFILPLILLMGCSSLPNTISEKISLGDTTYKVLQELGRPSSFEINPENSEEQAWGYKKRGDICAIGFIKGMVSSIDCRENPKYHGFFSSVLMGAGQGLQNASKSNSINCTSTTFAGQTNTNCH